MVAKSSERAGRKKWYVREKEGWPFDICMDFKWQRVGVHGWIVLLANVKRINKNAFSSLFVHLAILKSVGG
jgi:hypothetical protein